MMAYHVMLKASSVQILIARNRTLIDMVNGCGVATLWQSRVTVANIQIYKVMYADLVEGLGAWKAIVLCNTLSMLFVGYVICLGGERLG